MGQSASKVAKSVVSSTSRAVVGKDPTVVSSSVVGAVTATKVSNSMTNSQQQQQQPLQRQQHQAPPQHPPYISQESSSSPPSSSSYSIHDHHDAMQRRILEEKAGSLEYKEMPQDLVNFLKAAGPLQQRTTATISSRGGGTSDTAAQQERKLRLPRHLRHLESSNGDVDDEQHTVPSSSASSSSPEQRHVESMRLAENIPGFETSRSTNFSTKPAPNDNDDPTIFQAGQVLDIYDMIMLLRQRKAVVDADAMASNAHTTTSNVEALQHEEVVQEIYQQYSQKFAIPNEPAEQERHRELLRKTLAYLDVPVIVKDMADGSYDGVRPEHVADFEFLGGLVMPTTSVKNVLQDFSETRKQESRSMDNK
jgi:hypothetical protein